MGQTITVLPAESTCYRCVFETPPPGTPPTPRGPLGAVPGVIGSIQATEAIKFLLGIGQLLTDTLLVYDALSMTFRRIRTVRNQSCPLCGGSPPPPKGVEAY
jgi:molybdopterin/thiamine biosynthesis adenylyltransferase